MSFFTNMFKSFFDAGKFNVEVKIEPNDVNMHIAGGCVSGICIINCSGPASIRGFTLTHAVRSDFMPITSQGTSEVSLPHCLKMAEERIKDSKPIFKQEIVLFGSRKGGEEIQVKPGTYTYPFQIELPEGLPGSYSAGMVSKFSNCCQCCCECCGTFYILGGLMHSLDVKVIIANSFLDHNFDRQIDVQQAAPNNLLSNPYSLDCGMYVSAADCGCCCGCGCCARDANLALQIQLPRRDWVMGLDQVIRGRFYGTADVDFELCLLSTLKLTKSIASSMGHIEQTIDTKLVRTAFQGGKKGKYDQHTGGVEFAIPLPRDLPPSSNQGSESMYKASIEYTLVAAPKNVCCAWEFTDPSVPIVLNLWRALAAPKQNQQQMSSPPPPQPMHQQHHEAYYNQHQHHHQQFQQQPPQQQFQQQHHHHHHQQFQQPPPPQGYYPQANFAASGEVPPNMVVGERVYAYQAPPQNMQQNFAPVHQVTEANLPPVTWGSPVQLALTIPQYNPQFYQQQQQQQSQSPLGQSQNQQQQFNQSQNQQQPPPNQGYYNPPQQQHQSQKQEPDYVNKNQ